MRRRMPSTGARVWASVTQHPAAGSRFLRSRPLPLFPVPAWQYARTGLPATPERRILRQSSSPIAQYGVDGSADQRDMYAGVGNHASFVIMIGKIQSLATPLRSLSARLLLLTVFFVMVGEVFIFVPTIARFRVNYLEDK